MKHYKISVIAILCILLLGLAVVVKADDPPKTGDNLPETATNPPLPPVVKGSFDPVPIRSGTRVLDPATASVTSLNVVEENGVSAPAAASVGPSIPAVVVEKGSTAPGPIMLGEFDGETFHTIPDSATTAYNLAIGSPDSGELAGSDITASTSTTVAFENFDPSFGAAPPPCTGGGWCRFFNSGTTPAAWDDVPCFPVLGTNSAWAADLAGFDPCASDDYPINLNTWLVYGPFSMEDAQTGSLDFFFRIQSESFFDELFWGWSINGTNFFGEFVSGTHISGPFPNGHNFESFDFSNLAGQSQVWIGFNFTSDGSVTSKGPFIDAVTIRKNTAPRIFITQENFDILPFPNPSWLGFDNDGATNGEYYWDDVAFGTPPFGQGTNCPPRSGIWSMWPADEGANALNSCQGDPYADNMQSWLLYGPFDLTGASEAYVDFHYRMVSETSFDYLKWGASTDGTLFPVFQLSGTYTSGPHNNGYNLIRFDLSNTAGGDLRGEPTVWLAFIFRSDGSVTFQGPFLDDVSVVIEANRMYLPALYGKPPPGGSLTFQNLTNNPITVELVGYSTATFGSGVGPHVWNNIPPGNYEWLASGTCPATGEGQVGSVPPPNNRAPINIVLNQTTTLNSENGGKFDCNG